MKTRGRRAGHSLSPAAASLRLGTLLRLGHGLQVPLTGLGRRPGNPRVMDLGTYPAQDQEGLPQEGSCQVATIDISWTSEWWTEPNGGWVQAPLEALFGNRALSQQGNPPHHSSHTCCLCHPAYHPFPLFTNLAPSDLGPLSEIEFTLKDMLFIQGGYVVGMLTL